MTSPRHHGKSRCKDIHWNYELSMRKGKAGLQPDGSAARSSGSSIPGVNPSLVKDVEFSLSKKCNVATYERSKLALARFVGVQG